MSSEEPVVPANLSEIYHYFYGGSIGLALGLATGMAQAPRPLYLILSFVVLFGSARRFRESAIGCRAIERERKRDAFEQAGKPVKAP